MKRCPACHYAHNHANNAHCQNCKEPLPKKGKG